MEIKYNLPLPDVRFRPIVHFELLQKGDVVAYRKTDFHRQDTGVMVIGDGNMFLIASNWESYEDPWYNDYIDHRIELFEANEEETSWGLRAYFNYEYGSGGERKGLDAILKFVNSAFPNEVVLGWKRMEYCRNIMAELPWCIENMDWNEAKNELWRMAYKEIQNTGLQFNKQRVECFCFLIGVLMIADSTTDNDKLLELLRTFKRNWYHFVWMYALTIGRLMGTELKNFTGLVHQLDNTARVPYLHLYLPLIEGNVDKICIYNPSEKRFKLENAIKKMQQVEALEKRKTNLDEIYSIIFPKHFRQAMADNRPAPTIASLKEKVENLSTSVFEFNIKYAALVESFEAVTRASVSFEALEYNLLQLSRNTAEQVIADLLLTFSDDERIEKELKRMKKVVKENDKPTYQSTNIYQTGSVHEDKSTHLHLEHKEELKKIESHEQREISL